jgi:tetratricopeptide (TPR) repeat protein/peroxiredoxin
LVGEATAEDYAAAFRAANRMANEGKSWSGNEPNCCYLNTGQQRFADVSASSGLGFFDDGRAIAAVDWDQDGDLDLVQVNRTAPQLRFLRNDWQQRQHWVSFWLQGTSVNRDAIGARVLVYRRDMPGVDVRTLYAGSSFLSQSSNWVHFGLGDHAQIERVVVVWPGGTNEEFSGVQADGRFRLVQGSGVAAAVARRQQPVQLVASPPPVEDPTEHARVVVGSRVPLPPLAYEDFAGQSQPLRIDRPTLLQLWVSWCPMCQAEMHELTARAAEIQATGVRVLALSVDGLGNDQSTPQAALEALERLKYPYETGHATETMLRKLELLRSELYANLTPYPVPTSFLIDDQGRLLAIYLGPMQVDQLLGDLQQLSASATDQRLRELSQPFAGRWFTPPRPVLLAPLAQAFEDESFADDAAYYRQLAEPQVALSLCSNALDLEREGNVGGALEQYKKALQLNPQSAQILNLAGKFWVRRGKLPEARQLFASAVEMDAQSAEAQYNLASVELMQRNQAAALAAYREAVRIDPGYAEAHLALGHLLQQQESWTDSELHLQRALAANPRLAPAHLYLAVIYARQGQPDRAIASLRQALQIQPDLADAHTALGDLMAARRELAEAVTHYAEAVKINPQAMDATLKLAWYLATIPNKYPPEIPLKLAQRVAATTPEPPPQVLDVLAAAQAHAGQFPQAVATAQRALQRAEPKSPLARQIQSRLDNYRNGRPYRLPNVTAGE